MKCKGQVFLHFENVAITFQHSTHQKMTSDQLEQELLQMEKVGIVACQIVSMQDEPTQVWRTNVGGKSGISKTEGYVSSVLARIAHILMRRHSDVQNS
jgi:hypothetical protein